MNGKSSIEYKKIKSNDLIDMKLDSAILIENNNDYNIMSDDEDDQVQKCFPEKREIMSLIKELLKINPKIV